MGCRADEHDSRLAVMRGRERAFDELAEQNAKLTVENDILRVEKELLAAASAAGKQGSRRVKDASAMTGDTHVSDRAEDADDDDEPPTLLNALGHDQEDEEDIFPGLHFSLLQ